MTRLEAGALRPKREPADLGEVVGSTLARAAKVLAGHRVEVELAPDLPLLPLDEVLFEQALFNVLDNAAKYAPPGTQVTLRAWSDPAQQEVRLQVLDEGPGIAPAALASVFEKFYRAPQIDRRKAGHRAGAGDRARLRRPRWADGSRRRTAPTRRARRSPSSCKAAAP